MAYYYRFGAFCFRLVQGLELETYTMAVARSILSGLIPLQIPISMLKSSQYNSEAEVELDDTYTVLALHHQTSRTRTPEISPAISPLMKSVVQTALPVRAKTVSWFASLFGDRK